MEDKNFKRLTLNMDERHKDVNYAELQRLQSNISTLFQNLINEKNKSDYEKERSLSSLDSLFSEVTSLRKENEMLKKSNSNLKSSCDSCSELKKKLMIQDERFKKVEKDLDLLREFVSKVPYEEMNPFHFSNLLKEQLKDLCFKDVGSQVGIKTEPKSLTGSCTVVGDSPNINPEHVRSRDDLFCSKVNSSENSYFGSLGEKINKEFRSEIFTEATTVKVETCHIENQSEFALPSSAESKSHLFNTEFFTPKKVNNQEISLTVRRDLGISTGETSPILLDQRLPPNKISFITSSPNAFKRKCRELVSVSPIKLFDEKATSKSPKRRKYKSPAKGTYSKPISHLKKTNAIEVEISASGVRKLKQTQLNYEFYKGKSHEKDIIEENNLVEENANQNFRRDESKFGEDDLIFESPEKNFEQFLADLNRNSPKKTNERTHSELVIDPEETYVSSLVLKSKEEFGKRDNPVERENKVSEEKPRSPEYNSVHYLYKGSPVRKKAERKKLPGQMCMECNQYYKAVLGEIDQKKLQEILNKCSRHREHHYNIPDTPPGYWKPYLTATMDMAAEDDDTFIED